MIIFNILENLCFAKSFVKLLLQMRRNLFLTIYQIVVLLMMLISIFFLILPEKDVRVENYPFQNEMTYSGMLQQQKFSGEGTLEYQNNGTYQGTFYDGRMIGEGKFSTINWTYEASFLPGEPNRNIVIKNEKGELWSMIDGKWMRIKDEQENSENTIGQTIQIGDMSNQDQSNDINHTIKLEQDSTD